METKRKNRIRTERPKVRRVYVRLTNPDDPKDYEHFTAYELDVKELKRRIIGLPAVEPSMSA